jgi:Lon protease-like protein
MEGALEIPIFPLGTVLYPAGLLPLRIFEPRYVEMTRSCLRGNTVFGVSLIQAGFEVGKPAVPCTVGCTARIVEWTEPAPNRFHLSARGETRFRILRRWTTEAGLVLASAQLLPPPDPVELPSRYQPLRVLLQQLIGQFGADSFPRPQRLDDAAWVGYRLCELLPVPPERRQRLLEEPEPLQLLAQVEQLVRELRE